ncbi:hypothetical protein PPYR_13074 [Photinus pyralis]|uniref:Uncharacterized protein n=1 Tax=Photinus pyralis TaxID=7054 RepID=A0A5N4A812_PHOPY|nr:hypothetical protein PPYR_13074 [Photinus pyralis]
MLKKALIVNGNADISRFVARTIITVIAFMIAQNVNYVPKKSKILSVEDTRKFILEASDDFLLCKVVLIFGLYGACRRDELLKFIKNMLNYVLLMLERDAFFWDTEKESALLSRLVCIPLVVYREK